MAGAADFIIGRRHRKAFRCSLGHGGLFSIKLLHRAAIRANDETRSGAFVCAGAAHKGIECGNAVHFAVLHQAFKRAVNLRWGFDCSGRFNAQRIKNIIGRHGAFVGGEDFKNLAFVGLSALSLHGGLICYVITFIADVPKRVNSNPPTPRAAFPV